MLFALAGEGIHKSLRLRRAHAAAQLFQVLDIREALAVAEGEGQDLVEVSPQANPPVCRLQDYNKAKYAAKLREKVWPSVPATCSDVGPHNSLDTSIVHRIEGTRPPILAFLWLALCRVTSWTTNSAPRWRSAAGPTLSSCKG